MDRAEMVEILEEIARDENKPPAARVTAIRTLREVGDEGEEVPESVFEKLDELAPRRKAAA